MRAKPIAYPHKRIGNWAQHRTKREGVSLVEEMVGGERVTPN